MPSRIFQPPYTGVAVVQYFAYRSQSGGTIVPATEDDVRAIIDSAMQGYRRGRGLGMGATPILQLPADRASAVEHVVLRVVPDLRPGQRR